MLIYVYFFQSNQNTSLNFIQSRLKGVQHKEASCLSKTIFYLLAALDFLLLGYFQTLPINLF